MIRRTVLALSALALLAIPTTVAAAGTGGLPFPAQYSTTAKATGKTTASTKKPTPTPTKSTAKPTPKPTKTTAKPTPKPTKTTAKPTPSPTKTTAKPTPSPTKTTPKPTPPPVKCYYWHHHHKHPRPCYPPKHVSVTISRANPVVGQKNVIRVSDATPNALAKVRVITSGTARPNVQIAGVWESAGKTVGADGNVEFPVVLNAPGEFEIDILVDNSVVSAQKITAFTDEAAVIPAATLAGLSPLQWGLIGGAVVVLAGGAVFLIRRRGGAHAI